MRMIQKNKWEKLFEEYLNYAGLAIEYNENRDEDTPNRFWLIDVENTWEISALNEAQEVFEAHPSIAERIIDDLDEEIATLSVPEFFVGEDKQTYYYWEAGYWGLLRKRARSFGLEEWAKDHEFELGVCELMAFHTEDVNLEKFII